MSPTIRLDLSPELAAVVAAIFEADVTHPTSVIVQITKLLYAIPDEQRAAIARDLRNRINAKETASEIFKAVTQNDAFPPGRLSAREYVSSRPRTGKEAEAAGRAEYGRVTYGIPEDHEQ